LKYCQIMSYQNLTSVTFYQYAERFQIITYAYADIITYTMRALGTVTALINIAIFMHRKMLKSSETFYYLLAMSIFDFLYLGPLLLSNIINKLCSSSSTQCGEIAQYLSLFLVISVNNYLSSSFALFNIIFEIFLTIQRLFIIDNKEFLPKLTVRRLVLINLVISIAFYSPIGFQSRIRSSLIKLNGTNLTEFKLVNTEFGNSFVGKLTPIILSTVRIVLCGPILFAVSLANIFVLKKYLAKKKSFSSSAKANNKITIMLILTALLYTFGTLPYMVYYSISQIMPSFQNEFMSVMSWISRFCLCSLIILKMPVYYHYNRLYKRQFWHYFCVNLGFSGRDSLKQLRQGTNKNTVFE
jgi:hypothetical protein